MTALPTEGLGLTPVAPGRSVLEGRAVRARALVQRPATWVHQDRAARADSLAEVIELHPVRATNSSLNSPSHYYWTDRGIAVLVILVGAVFAVLFGAVVSAFLAVSDAPLSAAAPQSAASAPAVPGVVR